MIQRSDVRRRAIDTAETLFRAQGYAATGLTQILDESGAPKGSFYFHFPGGKHELALAALSAYGERVASGLEQLTAAHAGDLHGFIRALCHSIAAEMQASGWRAGCLAQNLAGELAPDDQTIADAVAAVFRSWAAPIAALIQSALICPASEAEQRALALIAGLEGSRTCARAMRDPAPFDALAEMAINGLRERAGA